MTPTLRPVMNRASGEMLVLLLFLLVPPVQADETGLRPAAETDIDTDTEPSLELLEFLGEWQTDDGDWVDPASLLSVPGEGGEQ